MMQLKFLHKEFDTLQLLYGEPSLKSIPGAGCLDRPRAMFVFMNPTARNVSAQQDWTGLRAPWLGTKNIWELFRSLGLISIASLRKIQTMRPGEWTPSFAKTLYTELKKEKVYVTNFAKCTQADARPLTNRTFKNYADLLLQEILRVQPYSIISFGNQVSSLLLNRPVSVRTYTGTKSEVLCVQGSIFRVYPTYYPVGQGRRNMPLAIRRIRQIINAKVPDRGVLI